jgi:hypothetical protein
MTKRKVESQTGNLIFDHKKLRIDLTPCVQVECDTSFESFWRELQHCFRFNLDRRSEQTVIIPQSCGNSNLGSFETPNVGSPGTKNHLDVGTAERCREYHMGEGGGFLRIRAVVSLVSPKLSMACPNIKVFQTVY